MPTQQQYAKKYGDTCMDLGKAGVEAFTIRRRARLEGKEPAPEELEAAQRRLRVPERTVRSTANEMKVAWWALSRPDANQYIARHRKALLQATRRAA